MARSQRSSKLETRTARLRLSQKAREFVTLGTGLALAYRRTTGGYGTWQARFWDGSRYHYRNLGRADDYQDANATDVLTFAQAQRKAWQFAEGIAKGHNPLTGPVTVREAAERYMAWYREHRRAVKETEHALTVHILSAFGERRLDSLSAPEIKNWLDHLASQPARVRTGRLATRQRHKAAPKTANEKRARRATANRILNILKAVVNRAFQDGLVADDSPWRRVKPFAKVDEARIRFLNDAEGVRLVNACAPDLRELVKGALLTGARYGELAGMRAQDVDAKGATVYIAQSKSGRPRHVPLNSEGVALFRGSVTGKKGDELVFTKKDGTPWGKNHHVRALLAACEAARIKPAVSFHELRHTYASHLAQAGVDLLAISKLLGHADTRITSKHYAHLADKTLAAAVTKLPSFGGVQATDLRTVRQA